MIEDMGFSPWKRSEEVSGKLYLAGGGQDLLVEKRNTRRYKFIAASNKKEF